MHWSFGTYNFSLQTTDAGISFICVSDPAADDFYAQACNIPSGEDVDSESPVKSTCPNPARIRSKLRVGIDAFTYFHSYPCASNTVPSVTSNDHRFTTGLKDFKASYRSS